VSRRRISTGDGTSPQQKPIHFKDGRFEFHGAFELRAMGPADLPAAASGASARELMSRAPVVIAAQGVDVVLEKFQEQ
jgi:hypothetical protein